MKRGDPFDCTLRVKAAPSAGRDPLDTQGSPERTLPEGPRCRVDWILWSDGRDAGFGSGKNCPFEMSQNHMGHGGTVFVEPGSQGTGVRNKDARGDERSQLHKLRDHRVRGSLCNNGHGSGRRSIPRVRHQIVLIDVSFRGNHSECHDAISDGRSSEQCLKKRDPQGPLSGHVTASRQYGHQSTGRPRGYRQHRGGSRKSRPTWAFADEAMFRPNKPKRMLPVRSMHFGGGHHDSSCVRDSSGAVERFLEHRCTIPPPAILHWRLSRADVVRNRPVGTCNIRHHDAPRQTSLTMSMGHIWPALGYSMRRMLVLERSA
jgi:hypothetical protein